MQMQMQTTMQQEQQRGHGGGWRITCPLGGCDHEVRSKKQLLSPVWVWRKCKQDMQNMTSLGLVQVERLNMRTTPNAYYVLWFILERSILPNKHVPNRRTIVFPSMTTPLTATTNHMLSSVTSPCRWQLVMKVMVANAEQARTMLINSHINLGKLSAFPPCPAV